MLILLSLSVYHWKLPLLYIYMSFLMHISKPAVYKNQLMVFLVIII